MPPKTRSTWRKAGDKVDPTDDVTVCGYYGHTTVSGPRTGQLCGNRVTEGTTACWHHSGMSKAQHHAQGAIVVEIRKWGLGDIQADPGEIMLRLLTQSAWRVDRYSEEIERVVAESKTLTAALTGESYTVTPEGKSVKTGEYVRAMTGLEAQERDRAMNYAKTCVAAGLAERMVRVEEAEQKLLSDAMMKAMADSGMDDQKQQEVIGRVSAHLRIAAS